MKIYMLSTYHENGSYDVHATLDKGKLPAMLADHFGRFHTGELKRLQYLLEKDECNDGEDLSDGWGGVQLHIVELE